MNLIEFLDRRDERRLERWRIQPPRPRDNRMLVGLLFFVGYYVMVFAIMKGRELPVENSALVKDAMLVLGPVVGVIAQALFRSDIRDEVSTANTGAFARAVEAQATATTAAANAGLPTPDVTLQPGQTAQAADTSKQVDSGG